MKVLLSSSHSPALCSCQSTLADCCEKVKGYVNTYKVTSQQWTGGQVYIYDEYVGRITVTGVFLEKRNVNPFGMITKMKR
ncbi:MAG TPA: hypothetical protein DCW90_09400 [Lachnospiraceae bacterium]|nr:hypothetical protein [Lachnospiraceae bacterium]